MGTKIRSFEPTKSRCTQIQLKYCEHHLQRRVAQPRNLQWNPQIHNPCDGGITTEQCDSQEAHLIPFGLLSSLSSIQDLRQRSREIPSMLPQSFPIQKELLLSHNGPVHTKKTYKPKVISEVAARHQHTNLAIHSILTMKNQMLS